MVPAPIMANEGASVQELQPLNRVDSLSSVEAAPARERWDPEQTLRGEPMNAPSLEESKERRASGCISGEVHTKARSTMLAELEQSSSSSDGDGLENATTGGILDLQQLSGEHTTQQQLSTKEIHLLGHPQHILTQADIDRVKDLTQEGFWNMEQLYASTRERLQATWATPGYKYEPHVSLRQELARYNERFDAFEAEYILGGAEDTGEKHEEN